MPTKQEEIRDGMESIIRDLFIYGGRNKWLPCDVVRKLQAFEHDQGVVIGVDTGDTQDMGTYEIPIIEYEPLIRD